MHRIYFENCHLDAMNVIRDAYRDDMPVIEGVLRAEYGALYYGRDDDPPVEEQVNL